MTTPAPARPPAGHEHRFERPPRPLLRPRDVLHDTSRVAVTAGIVGWTFAATGPVAIILAEAGRGGLSDAEVSSWIFGVFVLNGLLTIAASWLYRMPLAFYWTIPGTVVVGTALTHRRWSEILGVFLVSGLVMLGLGLTGRVRTAMAWLPMPIVMAMVAGVFLRFGLGLVTSLNELPSVAVPMAAAYLLLASAPRVGHVVPPVLGALLVGTVAVALGGGMPSLTGSQWLVQPVVRAPELTAGSLLELVVPLVITVLVVQNGQGLAVLSAAGHPPPMNVVTVACGGMSLLSSVVGAISTCLTGPTNALLVESGERRRQYVGALVNGVLALAFGLLAPVSVRLMLGMPAAFVAALAGLAMLPALRGAFVTAFSGRFGFGSLACFLVTVAGIAVLGISSAFWGLVAGIAVSWFMDRADLRAHLASMRGAGPRAGDPGGAKAGDVRHGDTRSDP